MHNLPPQPAEHPVSSPFEPGTQTAPPQTVTHMERQDAGSWTVDHGRSMDSWPVDDLIKPKPRYEYDNLHNLVRLNVDFFVRGAWVTSKGLALQEDREKVRFPGRNMLTGFSGNSVVCVFPSKSSFVSPEFFFAFETLPRNRCRENCTSEGFPKNRGYVGSTSWNSSRRRSRASGMILCVSWAHAGSPYAHAGGTGPGVHTGARSRSGKTRSTMKSLLVWACFAKLNQTQPQYTWAGIQMVHHKHGKKPPRGLPSH
jgi:hypothetical protein